MACYVAMGVNQKIKKCSLRFVFGEGWGVPGLSFNERINATKNPFNAF